MKVLRRYTQIVSDNSQYNIKQLDLEKICPKIKDITFCKSAIYGGANCLFTIFIFL